MSRRGRRDINSEKNISIITFWVIIAVAITAFIVAYMLYSNKLSTQAKKVGNTESTSNTENNMINMIGNTEIASSSIGKSVNELENSITNKSNENTVEKMAVNTSNAERKEENNTSQAEISTNENLETQNSEAESNETKTEEKTPNFVRPVEGEKIKDYSQDNLLYSATLEEWTTHLGIDYAAEKTDIVKASADGTIKSIKNDPRYGLTVVIEHSNGFESVYSNLLTAEFISVGEEVKQGQTIATIGNTARFEVADETHLHFEIKKDGQNVDPNLYIQ